jgi:hypothetical protein
MTTILCITSEPITISTGDIYDYSGEDRILRNILTNEHEVFYSGQNQGKMDYKLIESVESQSLFKIYYRNSSNKPFLYLGSTNISSIIRERVIGIGIDSVPLERLQIRLVLPFENIRNEEINTEFEGVGKYKKAVLQHSHFEITGQNLNLGFYKE